MVKVRPPAFPVAATPTRLVAIPGSVNGVTDTLPSRAEATVVAWVANSWACAQRLWIGQGGVQA